MQTKKQELSFEKYLNLRFDPEEHKGEIALLQRVHAHLKEGSIPMKFLCIESSNQSGKTTLIKKLLAGTPLEVLTCRNSEIPSTQFSSYEDLLAYMKGHNNYIVCFSHKNFITNKCMEDDCFNTIHEILVLSQQKNSLIIFEDWYLHPISRGADFRFSDFFPMDIHLPSRIPFAYKKYHLQTLPLTKESLAFLLKMTEDAAFKKFHSLAATLKLFSKQDLNNKEILLRHLQLYHLYPIVKVKQGLQAITGRFGLKSQLNEIMAKYRLMGRFNKMSVSLSLYYIFDGPPGVGKTFAVECLAEELGIEITSVDLKDIESGFVKDTLREASEKQNGGILFIDEIDKCLGKHSVFDKVSSMEGWFQQAIDGIGSFNRLFNGILIVNANEAWRLSESFRDRFQVITFSLPDEEDRKLFFEEKLGHLDDDLKEVIKQSFSLDDLITKTAGKSYREMNRLWADLVLRAVGGEVTFQQTAFEAKEQIAYVG